MAAAAAAHAGAGRAPVDDRPEPPAARPESIYEPPGPLSEALASYYVRHIVQRALDRAFTLSR